MAWQPFVGQAVPSREPADSPLRDPIKMYQSDRTPLTFPTYDGQDRFGQYLNNFDKFDEQKMEEEPDTEYGEEPQP